VHCEKCDESEKIDLVEKILILILVLENFPDSCLKLKKTFLHLPAPAIRVLLPYYTVGLTTTVS
jgi:hypothetical protein